MDKPLLVLFASLSRIVILLTSIRCTWPARITLITTNCSTTSASCYLTIPEWSSTSTVHLRISTITNLLMVVLTVAAIAILHCLPIRVPCSLTSSPLGVAAVYGGAFLRSPTRRCATFVATLLCLFWGLWWKFCELGVCVEVASSHLRENLSFKFHSVSGTLNCSNRLCYTVRCWEEFFKQSCHMLLTMFNYLSLHRIIVSLIRLTIMWLLCSAATIQLVITSWWWWKHTLRQSNALGPNQDPDYISTHEFFTLRQHLCFLLWISLWALLQLF